MKFSPYIKEAIIVADRRPFVSALLQIDFETVSTGPRSSNWPSPASAPWSSTSGCASCCRPRWTRANATMPQVPHVRQLQHLLTKELDHDDGEVTATMKVRRRAFTRSTPTPSRRSMENG